MGDAYQAWISNDSVETDVDAFIDAYDGTKSEAVAYLIRRGIESDKDIDSPMIAEGGHSVEIEMSAFEARIIGNRLWKAGEALEKHTDSVASETKWLARRFHRVAGLR